MTKGREIKPAKRKMLWVGDAISHTGFATVTDNIVRRLLKYWDIDVLGINYFGDPHDKPYRVYPAFIGGDYYGSGRLEGLLRHIKPDIVVFLNDPWVVAEYAKIMKAFPHIYRAAYMPVDGLNIPPKFTRVLDDVLDLAVAYNEFGKNELQASGFTKPITVIQHGVDLNQFFPVKKEEARRKLGLPEDLFIIGFVGRNQPRKRIDLLMQAFALFAKDKPEHVRLYYHGALVDTGWDIEQLAAYFGIDNRLIVTSRDITPVAGVSLETLNLIYNSFDVHASATHGEGFGLTHAESAACGIPQVAPDWSGLGEWLKDAAILLPCSSTFVNTGGINTIGGVINPQDMADAFNTLYQFENIRIAYGKKARYRVQEPRFSWNFAADAFHAAFVSLLKERKRDFITERS